MHYKEFAFGKVEERPKDTHEPEQKKQILEGSRLGGETKSASGPAVNPHKGRSIPVGAFDAEAGNQGLCLLQNFYI